jgi:hypothetical protein
VPQEVLTAAFSAGPVHSSPATSSGRREMGQAHKRRLPPRQGLGTDSDSMVSDGQGGELWVLVSVYIPCGDLTTSVIHTVTLGLAY